jgi:hypothetical protein
MAVTRKSATKSLKTTAKKVATSAKQITKETNAKAGIFAKAAKAAGVVAKDSAKKAIKVGAKAGMIAAASEFVHDVEVGLKRNRRNAKVKKVAAVVAGVAGVAAATAVGVAAVRARRK